MASCDWQSCDGGSCGDTPLPITTHHVVSCGTKLWEIMCPKHYSYKSGKAKQHVFGINTTMLLGFRPK